MKTIWNTGYSRLRMGEYLGRDDHPIHHAVNIYLKVNSNTWHIDYILIRYFTIRFMLKELVLYVYSANISENASRRRESSYTALNQVISAWMRVVIRIIYVRFLRRPCTWRFANALDVGGRTWTLYPRHAENSLAWFLLHHSMQQLENYSTY